MMVTGVPGHNRGKKFIPGVGYRYPPREKTKPHKCDFCDSLAVYFEYLGDRKTSGMCESCWNKRKGATDGDPE